MANFETITKPDKVAEFIAHLRTPLYRNGYALMFSTGITSVLGFLYWAVAARVYQTDDVGLNSMAISIMIFLSSVAQINLQEAMIRFIPRAGVRTLRLVLYSYGIVAVLSILVGIVFCLGISLWAPALSFLIDSPGAILWFAFALMLWGFFVLEDSILIGLRQALYIPFENAIFSVIKIAALVLLASTMPRTGIFASWTLSVVLIIIPVNWLIFKRLIPKHVENSETTVAPISIREMAKYVAANYAAALLASVSTAVLPIMITQIAGATANAHFYVAWIIATSLQIVAANMSTSLTVEASLAGGDLESQRRHTLSNSARILLPLVILVVLSAPLVLKLVGASYDEGTVLLQLLAISAIPNLFNMLHVGIARAQNRVWSIIGVYGANAIIALGLSFFLLPHMGITGIGVAWLITQTGIAAVLIIAPKLHRVRTSPEG
jgi:O-antigen/teichoic acid export membrane protein